MEFGILTDKDQHSELDVQNQKEFPNFLEPGRWQTGHADARQSYDICKRLIGCAKVGAVKISVEKNTETGGHLHMNFRKFGRPGVESISAQNEKEALCGI